MHVTAHNTLIINSIKNLITEGPERHRALWGGEKALLENTKNIILKGVIGSMFDCCYCAEVVQ